MASLLLIVGRAGVRLSHRLAAGMLLLASLWCGHGAWAHATPESRVWVDSTADGMRLTLLLPLNRLEFGFGVDLLQAPDQVLVQHRRALAAYVLRHVALRSGDQTWLALPPTLTIQGNDATADLEAVVDFKAPEGTDRRQARLSYDVITHEVMTHRVQVFLRSDWAGGRVSQAPRLLGELDARHVELPLTLPASASPLDGLWQLVHEGIWHILDGADHLLFLLTLLLVSPLTIHQGRWAQAHRAREAWRHTAWVVSAFTLGHTCTLVLGSAGWLPWPVELVELAVAASIAMAAVHALKPLRGVGDVAMALAFGLVHGQAFSASLSGAGLSWGQHALALAAFNLGIELAQLGVVCVALPMLWWLQARQPLWGGWLRKGLAWMALAAATWWMHERWSTDWVSDRALPFVQGLALCLLPLWACAWLARRVTAPA